MGQNLIIVSIILVAASAALGFVNRSNLLKTKEALLLAQNDLAKAKDDLTKENKTVGDSNKALSDLTLQKQSLDSDLAKQKAELDAKATQLSAAGAKLTKAEGDLAIANTDILAKSEKITQLEAQVAAAATVQQAPVSSEDDKARITSLESDKEKLTADNEVLVTKLASLQKADKEKLAKKNLTSVTGRVLAVNQAWNFVVLSLGNKSGIESNMEFFVKRGATLIGKVRTTTVEPSTSIADIIPSSLARGLSIQPGDDIIYQSVEN
jgi:hypothetical protein